MIHVRTLLLPYFVCFIAVLSLTNACGQVVVGAARTQEYVHLLKGKSVAMVVNHTSVVGKTHLVDSLLTLGVRIKTIFAPEHGFRGDASAGEKITNSLDPKTGVKIVSLYGKNLKPTAAQLADIDIVVFDIQDVGVRFYTYISTMTYVMDACADNNKQLLILDRPNPNGHYVDGPVLDLKLKSFVGMLPIPVVHGLTVGELATMIKGEKWGESTKKLKKLTVIKCQNYTHQTAYAPPIAPSPNLPNLQAIQLYPSLCFFEATNISVGRGTEKQFQVIGGTDAALGTYQFTPVDRPGAANPPNRNKLCYGQDLSTINSRELGFTPKYLIEMYQKSSDKASFFNPNNFFEKLSGTSILRDQIKNGASELDIRSTWQPDLDSFITKRKEYLLYKN